MKSVYKVCLSVLVMLPLALCLGAQPKDGKGKDPEFWKKAQSEKLEFITKRLELPDDSSEAFLKVYKENEKAKGELFHKRQEALSALKDALKSGDDAEIQSRLKAYVDARAKLEAWENSDCERFSKVLTQKQVAALMVAEEDFRKEQIHRLGRRGGGPGEPPRDGRRGGDGQCPPPPPGPRDF